MHEPTAEELLAAGDPRFLKKFLGQKAEAENEATRRKPHGPQTDLERQEKEVERKAKLRRKMESRSRKVNRKIAAKKHKATGSKRRR